MKKVFICSAKRTPIASLQGSLKSLDPAVFAAEVVRSIISENSLDASKIDELIVGNVLSANRGQCVGRQVSIKSGIPQEVPGYSINMVCGSGLKAVTSAYTNVALGISNLIIAGGTESMSQAPYLLPASARTGMKFGDFKVIDHMLKDGLIDAYTGIHMGVTAENIVRKHSITRDEQDEFAFNSQQKAINAIDNGAFKDEIVPITIKERKSEYVFDQDEYPNRGTSLDKIKSLRPAFEKDGTVTAATSSGINDGAAFLLIASEEAVKEHGLNPIAEIVGIGQGGVDPNVMGLGPVPAIRNALKHANLKLTDMDVLELNEAFAAQSIGVVKELSEEHNVATNDIFAKTNINGGAIALGHPIGASGARILVTLTHILNKNKDFKYGLSSLCIGGGMGCAVIIKNIK